MMKKYSLVLIILLIVVIISFLIYMFSYSFFGPFETPPSDAGANCDKEYRFKFDAIIKSEDEFIQFLKDHQFEGKLIGFIPTEDKLIPDNTNDNPINLDEFKTKINIETSKAIFSAEKIYSLTLRNSDFDETWSWMLHIKVSETGHVSIKHCAGV